MKKEILVMLTASALTVTAVACSKDEGVEINNDIAHKSSGQSAETTSSQSESSYSLEQNEIGENMSADEKEANELFQFYADHNQFGKYVKSVEKREKTILVTLGNSYEEMKKSQPFNIQYNEVTFPELYGSYVKNDDYSNLNAYLIVRTAYTLANYDDIDRVIVNVPKNSKGKFYVADVKREDINLVLGFDVNTLKRGDKETDLGEEFITKFANEYSYKQSDFYADANTRYINKFIKQSSQPIKVDKDAVAIINTYYLPIEDRPTMTKLFRNATEDILYADYITDNFNVTSNGIELELDNKIIEEKGEEETQKALVYISGRLLAEFPELQNVTILAGTEKLKVNRPDLTKLIGKDISTLVDIDQGEIANWNDWATDFVGTYVDGNKLSTYIKAFQK
ncbi:hypothetical protein U8V72_21220 [Priestia filamentosa]|uniref:hypothetical protein n=1 Tax=Priestia filamentosa TaxID=1402861 RepID=UPI00397D3B8D